MTVPVVFRRTLGTVVIHVFSTMIWAMEQFVDENLWEEVPPHVHPEAASAIPARAYA